MDPPRLPPLVAPHLAGMPLVVVALPARDEAGSIGAALQALAAQVDGAGAPLRSFGVLLLVNNCAGDTAERAREAAPAGLHLWTEEVTLPPPQANVVGARRAALDCAAQWTGDGGVIVSTDANTRAGLAVVPARTHPRRGRRRCRAHFARRGRGQARRGCAAHPATRRPLPHGCLRTDRPSQPGPQRSVAPALAAFRREPGPERGGLPCRGRRAAGGLPGGPGASPRPAPRRQNAAAHTTGRRLHQRWPVGLERSRRRRSGRVGAGGVGPADGLCGRLGNNLPRLWRAEASALGAALHAPTFGLALEAAHAACEAGDWHALYPPIPVEQAWAEVQDWLDRTAAPPVL